MSPNKTVLFPKQVDILSWVWNQGGFLSPSPHRKQALAETKTEDIQTIKDLRSWLGLYKTFIDCTPNLTRLLDPFDSIVGGKDSKDTVTWTPLLLSQFNTAQAHIKNMQNIYLPQADDQLIITCDGARTPPAVGMVLQARTPSGETKIVRYYSVKLKSHHVKWFPCELEAAALGTAVEAFYEFIKQSNKPVIICPDSKSVVDAARKLAKGHFSLSPRIQTFLNNLGKINHDIQHISGKSGHNAAGDYQSRSAADCSAELCQICNYVNFNADTVIDVKLNSVTDPDVKPNSATNPEYNSAAAPFLNRSTWKHIQEKDRACTQAKNCLLTGQIPSKKSGKVNVETRRILEKATIAKDGLLVVNHTIPLSTTKLEKIVVPSSYIDSVISQLHQKFQHPAKSQFMQLFNKYFFAQGSTAAIESLYANCQLCKAAQILPKQLHIHHTETNAKQPGTHFGIDVLRRAKQKIMVCTDQFSTFVTATFLPDESSDSLKDGIIKTTQTVRHSGQVIVRVDAAPGFKSLYMSKNKSLADLDISLELGEVLNKNSNACVDKSISELNQEIKKLVFHEVPIDEAILSRALISLNNKLRRNGQLSSSNILFSRDRLTNVNLQLNDKEIAHNQLKNRQTTNAYRSGTLQATEKHKPATGDIVMLKSNPAKHNIRDSYLVTGETERGVTIQKVTNCLQKHGKSMIRNIKYNIKSDRIMKIENHKILKRNVKPMRNTKTEWTPFRISNSSSDTDSDEDLPPPENREHQHNSPEHQPLEPEEYQDQVHSDSDENIHISDFEADVHIPEQHDDHHPSPEPQLIEPPDEHILIQDLPVPPYEEAQENNPNSDPETSGDYNSGAEEPQEPDYHALGAKPKKPKKIQEEWVTREKTETRPAASKCKANLKKWAQEDEDTSSEGENSSEDTSDEHEENARDGTEERSLLITPLDMSRQRTTDNDADTPDEDLIQEPSLEWDWDADTTSPSFINQGFLNSPDQYPDTVVPGRVYNFDNLPPLPVTVTSPPASNKQPVTSTPLDKRKPKNKTKKRVLEKIGSFFHL